MKGRSRIFLQTLFVCRPRLGSCFVFSPSHNGVFQLHRGVVSRIGTSLANSIDSYDGDNVDSFDSFQNNSWSALSDWVMDSSDFEEIEEIDNANVGKGTKVMSEEDIWIQDAVDEIYNLFPTLDDDSGYEHGTDDKIQASIESEMDEEIAMLVRCNEDPESLLIAGGRAYAPLTNDEKNEVSQLVFLKDGEFEATKFLRDAVSTMFREHAVPSTLDGILSMDRASIASWMTKSLKSEGEGKVSQHDHRVLKTLSDFGSYGSGRLVEEEFQNLYLRCIVGDASNLSTVSVKRHFQLRTPFRDAVWRDIRAHGMISQVEQERLHLVEEQRERTSKLTVHGNGDRKTTDEMFVDECEILDWDYNAPELKRKSKSSTKGSSSHELVEMASDQKTPLRMRDGEFVFIDEESCIGCTHCALIAPTSFKMVESGRARTYFQRNSGDVNQAIDSCPVSCMHHVSYDELKTFETARDKGDMRLDSKNFRQGFTPIPLHVAGMDSDRNRQTSWYHSLKFKCFMSPNCPQKGCYDCPLYNKPGGNPFFIAKHKEAEHIRAQHFIESGEADDFRKKVDL